MFRFLKLFLLLCTIRFHRQTTQIMAGTAGNRVAREGATPFEFSRPFSDDDSFSFNLLNFKNAQFLLSVTIQGKKFNLLVDTGSSTTWVNSDLCTLPICKSKERITAATKGSKKKTAVYYGGEKMEGVPTFEVIDFGGGNTFTSQLLALTDISYGVFVSV